MTSETEPAQQDKPSGGEAPQQGARGLLWRLRRLLHRCRRTVISLLALGMLAHVLLVLTPATEKLFDWLDVSAPPQQADLIVCLGGDYERILWAADMFRRGMAPKVAVSNAPGAAEEMRRLLEVCGIPRSKIALDRGSYITNDHPRSVGQLPGVEPQRTRLLIVTSREHSRRAAACFHKAGYTHLSMYCGPRLNVRGVRWRIVILPRLAYEYAGLVQYWLQGRI